MTLNFNGILKDIQDSVGLRRGELANTHAHEHSRIHERCYKT